ncbi:MAG: methyltransferase domain-containing protein [Phenylobacterium sp.]|nr:methyltransferase domain-containing protein [Phenylobacterium sp.]
MRVDGNRFRRARLAKFLELVPSARTGEPIRILDIGGTRSYWESMTDLWSHLPLRFTIVNLEQEHIDDGVYALRSGNACDLAEYPDNAFDVIHSNSVIEHVGHWSEMRSMANEVRRLAPSYFVQTPNFWFPMEPHYRTLGFQWWPEATRARMLMRKRRGFRGPAASLDAAMKNIQSVNLLTASQVSELFPDAKIDREMVFGLAKSIIATRRAAG